MSTPPRLTVIISSSILKISPLVGDECLDHFLDGQAELDAEFIADVFLDGSFESISDIFLESRDKVPFCVSNEIFLSMGDITLPSLSLPCSSSVSSSARTSCLFIK